jgi:chromosome segregation ATPase
MRKDAHFHFVFPSFDSQSSVEQEKEELQQKYNEDVGNLTSSLRQITSKEKMSTKWKNRAVEKIEDSQEQIYELASKLEECEGVFEAFKDHVVERFVNNETDLKENRDEQHDLENEQTNLRNELEKVQDQATTTSNDVHDLQIAHAANAVKSNVITECGEEDLGDSQTSNHLTSNKFVAGIWTTPLTVANERTKTTSRRGRTVKLSEKAQDDQSADLSYESEEVNSDSSDDDQILDTLL